MAGHRGQNGALGYALEARTPAPAHGLRRAAEVAALVVGQFGALGLAARCWLGLVGTIWPGVMSISSKPSRKYCTIG